MVITQINGFDFYKKSSQVIFEQFHHFSIEFSCRNNVEKFVMVICTYSVHITMEDFRARNIVF